jgi:peroxiredoxin
MTTTQLQAGDAAPDLSLPDYQGHPVMLSEFWLKQPIVLLFLRHFG